MNAETPVLRPGDRVRVTPAPYEAIVISGNAVGRWSARRVDTTDTAPEWYGTEFRGAVEVIPEPTAAAPSTPDTDLRDKIASVLAPYQVHDVALDDVLYVVELAMYPISHDLAAVQEELDRRDAELSIARDETTLVARSYLAECEKTDRLSTALRKMARKVTRKRRGIAEAYQFSDAQIRDLHHLYETKIKRLTAERDQFRAESERLRQATTAEVCGHPYQVGKPQHGHCTLTAGHDGYHHDGSWEWSGPPNGDTP
ncbi:hypothetical protein N8J89_07820 [Crossiella sp. CA-258035]|uniref:hypothetical protein n=1 Tax=Crossiella sp. CA-258035 TaxID=2981138 RepID=UPI0024BCBE6A|nr:hypothetical protein [Crossiella sp. CA-258035]WHT20961.1 hypothetical protein N8J89_07820 [Crossiella sp. CA-258035]